MSQSVSEEKGDLQRCFASEIYTICRERVGRLLRMLQRADGDRLRLPLRLPVCHALQPKLVSKAIFQHG